MHNFVPEHKISLFLKNIFKFLKLFNFSSTVVILLRFCKNINPLKRKLVLNYIKSELSQKPTWLACNNGPARRINAPSDQTTRQVE